MNVAHILRKYDPVEWGGTETAVLRLLEGLNVLGVRSSVHCPRTTKPPGRDPLSEAGATVRRFNAFVPVVGIPREQREQLVRWGGNVMSFQLFWQLLGEPVDVIHTHALNRLAGVGLMASRWRNVPLVVTIHGGALDLPKEVESQLTAPLRGGLEWGKAFGLLLQSRRVLEKADAILACNPREADLLTRRYPRQRVVLQQHSVPAASYARDQRDAARQAFPMIRDRDILLCVARLDPVKNQHWLIQQLPEVLKRHPKALLVLAGAATSQSHETQLLDRIAHLGLQDRILLTGGLDQGGAPIVGLMQLAKAILLPSTSETFGLAILEAWAAGTPIVSSRTSGACSLIRHRENGWLFNLDAPGEFHAALDEAMTPSTTTRDILARAALLVRHTYDTAAAAARVKRLYEELHAARQGRKTA